MATRRIVSSEKSVLERDDKEFSQAAGEKSNIAPAVPAHVIYKLLGFTLAMVVGPIGTYFLTVDLIGSTPAGALAAIMANVVLVGYVVVAFKEDQSDALEAAEKEKESKKGR